MPATAFSPFDAAAILIVLAAGLGYINVRLFQLPSSIGLTIMGALASLLVIAADRVIPGLHLADRVAAFLNDLDFHRVLMEGMLSFLLFAGAMHVDWYHMRQGAWPIAVFSTIGVILSTVLVGVGFYFLAAALGQAVPMIWCMVFGALISPTDPVAVIGVMKRAAMSETLQATVAGESLFNDGIGVVVFSILFGIASGSQAFSWGGMAHDFVREAGGGALLGLLVGALAYRLMHSIDDYAVEVLMTLAVVMGGYSLAMALHISGPVAMAVAGLLIGNAGLAQAMSDVTQDYVVKFWELIDEILNAVLFLLIGLEVIAIGGEAGLVLLSLFTVPLVLLARVVSVGLPLGLLRGSADLGKLAFPTLVWGGLRGGISVALALSLPVSPQRGIILAATYGVVLFAVVVQGWSITKLIERLSGK